MLMGVLALLAVLSVPLSGKDLRLLGRLHVRAPGLLPVALGLQVLVINIVPGIARPIAVTVHLATYLLAAAFLWLNRRVSGLLVLAAGACSNALAIALNGGTLPASRAALEFAGLTPEPGEFTNSGALDDPRLPWLGDVFALPAGLPFANVFSVGDVLILVGATLALHRACAQPPPAPAPALDPMLLQDRQAHVEELERTQRTLRETGARNDELARELAARRQQPEPPPALRWPTEPRRRRTSPS